MPGSVGSQDANPFLPDDIDHFLLNLRPEFVHFGKPSGREDHLTDPLFGAFAKGLGGVLGGEEDDGEVDAVGQAGDRGKNRKAKNLSTSGVDQEEPAGIIIGEDVSDHIMAGFSRVSRGPDDGDARRLKKGGNFSFHGHLSG